MRPLQRSELLSLEDYADARSGFRARVMRHKRDRRVQVGPCAALYFEDRLTIQYQVQEMLRTERIFERQGIEEELAAYNPLIPDGSNWKATFMIEIDEPAERRRMLARLVGVEDRIWVRVAGHDPVFAIADEDLERDTGEKTSSVHFLRFELQADMIGALRADAELSAGIDHEAYRHQTGPLPGNVREALLADLD